MVENNIEQLSEMVNLNKDIQENPKIEVNNIKNKVNKINKNINDNISLKNAEQIENINKQIEDINNNKEVNIPIIRNTNVNKNKLFNPIGILDPEGKELNPLTGEQYSDLYKKLSYNKDIDGKENGWSVLPTYSQRDDIIKTLYDNQCLLLTAGTGAGKTVLIPKFALHVLNYQGRVAITIPKRVPTIEAADYAAVALDVKLGEQVGYMVKDDKKSTSATKLVYATDGYILAKLTSGDPNLEEFDALIIDEAHERNERIDQLLLLVKEILRNRPKFKLIIMSATIDPKLFMNYYKEFGIKHIELGSEPLKHVEEIFLKEGQGVNKVAPNGEIISRPEAYIEKAAEVILKEIILVGKPGDILVFFPGKADCDEGCKTLEKMIKDEIKKNPTSDFSNKPFCISLSSASKKKTFRNGTQENYSVGRKSYKNFGEGYTRRIIMSTEVAESAVTFKGDAIDFVIDTGLSNTQRYYPNTETEALEKRYISKANHKQRKGRTGRLREGTCYNIFTKNEYEKLFLEYPIPPILQMDVTPIILSFLTKPNITNIDIPFTYPKKINNKVSEETLNSFLEKFITPPDISYVSNAIKKLFLIGALSVENNKANFTQLGKALSFFRDISPEKAASVIESYNYKCHEGLIDVISILEVVEDRFSNILISFNAKSKDKKSPEYEKEQKEYEDKMKKLSSPYGDHITLYKIMKTYINKNYDVTYERGRRTLVAKGTGEGAQWAQDNYINPKLLQKAIKIGKNIDGGLGRVIGQYKRDNPEKANDRFIFRDNMPNIHDKIEDNIMQSIVKGFIGNIAKKVGRSYSTCFPEKTEIADIDNFSLFKYVTVKPATAIYGKLISIKARKKFQTFTKVPIKVIENLSSGMKEDIKKCASSSKETEPKKFNKGFSGSKNKWKGSKGSKGKFKGSKGKEKKYKDKRN